MTSCQLATLIIHTARIARAVQRAVRSQFDATRFATTSDGSAAAVWRINSSGGYDLRSSQRVGVSGAWSTPQTVGTTSFPYGEQIAIDSSRSTTVVWTGSPSGSDFEFRVRSRVGGTWGLTLIAGQMPTAAWSARP